MKIIFAIAVIALLALAGVEANRSHSKDSPNHLMASSKTIVSVEPNLHRFCIPIGKKANGSPKDVSLHVPRTAQGFSVKLDTDTTSIFSSPLSADDKQCKRVSSLFLVKDHLNKASFVYSSSEIAKQGTISGYIVGPKPAWISVRMAGTIFHDVSGADQVCRSILGVTSESAQHDSDNNDEDHTRRYSNAFTIFRKGLRIVGWSTLSIVVVIVCCKIIKACCCCRKKLTPEQTIEMGPVPTTYADEEARDLAVAIERSLSDEQKVVEVPQSAQPQFVFLPPQFMPAPGSVGAGATPYVPMFAPQFMNYSLEERK